MIETGGRTDIIIQWFSTEFIKEHNDVFKRITVGPGEAVMVIKDGVPEHIVTESSFKLNGGIWDHIKDLFKSSERQIIVADLKPFALSLPFSGYSKDRTKIGGCANITVRVSKNNMFRLFNFLRRETISDVKWGSDRGKVKEITREDLIDAMSYDTSLVIDTSVLSQTMSSEIRDNIEEFNQKVQKAINTMTPCWSSNGLDVDLARIEMTQNAYEDAVRHVDEISKLQILKDAEYASKEHEINLITHMNELVIRNKSKEEMAKLATYYEQQEFKLSKDQEMELDQLDHVAEVKKKEMSIALETAKTQSEIDLINGHTEDEREKAKIDLSNYSKMESEKINQYAKDQDTRRAIELMNAQRTIEIQKAYDDGVTQGKLLAKEESEKLAKIAEENGYNRGRADGLIAGINKTNSDAINMTSAFMNINRNAQPQDNNGGSSVFCTFCGTKMDASSRFCPGCGKEKK